MLPRLWLLVGSDRPTDRQCHLLSCPGQLKNMNNMNNVHWTSTSAKPLIGTTASTSCSAFSSVEHPHSAIPHNVGILNIASVYCWYIQHPEWHLSGHQNTVRVLVILMLLLVLFFHVDVQNSAKLANWIESGQIGDKLINRCWFSWCWCAYYCWACQPDRIWSN